MDIRAFWSDVDRTLAEISPKYPDGTVYLISRQNREKNTTAGTVTTAHLLLASECLVFNTHDLATPEQINKYKQDQVERRRQIQLTERSKKQEFVMVVDRNEAEARSIPLPHSMEPSEGKANRAQTNVALK